MYDLLIDVYVSKYLGEDKENHQMIFGKEELWQMTLGGYKVDKNLTPVAKHNINSLPTDGRYMITGGYKYRRKID
jgi:hypothetical protein